MSNRSTCFIPGCVTASRNYGGPGVSVFICRLESEKFRKWEAVIPIDWTKTTKPKVLKVCEEHFKPEEVLRVKTSADQHGVIHRFYLDTAELAPGALPVIYKELPPSIQIKPVVARPSREQKEAKRHKREEEVAVSRVAEV